MSLYFLRFLFLVLLSTSSFAEITFMSETWAKKTCQFWNKDQSLVKELGGKWIANNAERGYKVIHLYRSDCKTLPPVELTISDQKGLAKCTYGGIIKHAKLNEETDYLMYATDEDWKCMGKAGWGCGPMGAMMTGKLKLDGPKNEAMSAMDAFEYFLKVTGKVPANHSCPK